MPPEVWAFLTNAGPVAGIMGYMWWLERKDRKDYQTKYEALLEGLPDRLMGYAEDQRESNDNMVDGFKKLTTAVWASIKRRPGGPYRSLPSSGEDDA